MPMNTVIACLHPDSSQYSWSINYTSWRQGGLVKIAHFKNAYDQELIADLPGQIWSRMKVSVRLDRNQGGHGHAQDTVHARRDPLTSADG